MKICYFGTYEKNYPRNRNIVEGVKLNNIDVVELHEDLFGKLEDKTNISKLNKLKLLLRIPLVYLKLALKKTKLKNIDFVVVGYLGQLDIFIARILFPTKKIIYNPMISLYDTIIKDRKLFKNYFIKRFFFYFDKLSCQLADKIILDTPEHAQYFVEKFKINKNKISHVYIGADENIFSIDNYKQQENKKFIVLFYGKFTPIHGIEHIVKAAKNLKNKNIYFDIIGTGQVYSKIIKLAEQLKIKNINFIDWIPFKDLPKKIAESSICIGGHFGESNKAKRVVSNKAFQIIAMGKPMIISDSPASTSAGFIDKYNAMLCPGEDYKKLSNIILELKNNQELYKKIQKNSLKLFTSKYTKKEISKQFLKIIQKNA